MTHAERYEILMARLREDQRTDSHHIAACYVLAFDEVVAIMAKQYISHEGIDFAGLQERWAFSEEKGPLINIVYNLFDTGAPCTVTPSAIASLELPWLEVVLNAMLIVKDYMEIKTEDKAFVFNFTGYKRAVSDQAFFQAKMPQTSLWPR